MSCDLTGLLQRLPIFPILTSVDVLTLGTYTKLPSCIKVNHYNNLRLKKFYLVNLFVKERILPVENISDEDKESTLQNLNRIIQCRLALSELPGQMRNFKIGSNQISF
jgi:hypothetical protein